MRTVDEEESGLPWHTEIPIRCVREVLMDTARTRKPLKFAPDDAPGDEMKVILWNTLIGVVFLGKVLW